MHQVTIGIIGCGMIGKYHLRHAASADNIKVAALSDLDVELAKETARQYQIESVFANGLDLIESADLDAVVLAVPTDVRFELAQAALLNRKHILLEKPAAMNVDQIKKLKVLQGDCVVASCSSRNRAMTSAQVATDFISSGQLGDVQLLHCRAMNFSAALLDPLTPQWRLRKSCNGGGVFSNWGSYDLDFLLGICGWCVRPKMVLAQTWMLPTEFAVRLPIQSDVETHVAAMIYCDNDIVIHYERSESTASCVEDTWQIVGSKGALSLSLVPKDKNQVIFDSVDINGKPVQQVLWEGCEGEDCIHAGPLTDFVNSIVTESSPRTGLDEALVIQVITDAVYASANTRCAVEIGSLEHILSHASATVVEV